MKFQHVNREGNALADYLAHVALESTFGTHVLDHPIGNCNRLLLSDSPEATSSSSTTV